jgi:hypothetical protein
MFTQEQASNAVGLGEHRANWLRVPEVGHESALGQRVIEEHARLAGVEEELVAGQLRVQHRIIRVHVVAVGEEDIPGAAVIVVWRSGSRCGRRQWRWGPAGGSPICRCRADDLQKRGGKITMIGSKKMELLFRSEKIDITDPFTKSFLIPFRLPCANALACPAWP